MSRRAKRTSASSEGTLPTKGQAACHTRPPARRTGERTSIDGPHGESSPLDRLTEIMDSAWERGELTPESIEAAVREFRRRASVWPMNDPASRSSPSTPIHSSSRSRGGDRSGRSSKPSTMADSFWSYPTRYCSSTRKSSGGSGGRLPGRLFSELLRLRGANIRHVNPSYFWRAIPHDPDDDKFVDAAVAADADWIVTQDHHFNVLFENDALRVRHDRTYRIYRQNPLYL